MIDLCKSLSTSSPGQIFVPKKKQEEKKKVAEPLITTGDLAHTLDEKFVLAYPPNLPIPSLPSLSVLLGMVYSSISEFKTILKSTPNVFPALGLPPPKVSATLEKEIPYKKGGECKNANIA